MKTAAHYDFFAGLRRALFSVCLLAFALLPAAPLPGQTTAEAPAGGGAKEAEKTAATAPEKKAKVDREALRKAAKARRDEERRFSEDRGGKNPFLQQHFPEDF